MTKDKFYTLRRWMRATTSENKDTKDRRAEFIQGKQGVSRREIERMEIDAAGSGQPIDQFYTVYQTLPKRPTHTAAAVPRTRKDGIKTELAMRIVKAAEKFGRSCNA